MSAVDLAFDLAGVRVPGDYALALQRAVLQVLEWLATEPLAGIHPLRGPRVTEGVLLPRRAKLVLRVPSARLGDAATLSGARLEVGGESLTVGHAHERPLAPFPTLHARLVATGAEDETAFEHDLTGRLEALAVPARAVIGRRTTLAAENGSITGYAVALHGLTPEQSLRVQDVGVGAGRLLGCGLFVPHKTISGLD